ncbi:hypothetical protein MNB_SM-7-1521 [hydrothermal vent metagenome]|uniref:Uncharacterized protein n=1 Tax=hydrothermal vent metagenome TaxID=652676 RepID=A0A1W1B9C6_9ZZZZ
MSSHKHHEHLERIKEAVKNSKELTQEEKSNSLKHIEEWIEEDKATGILYEELIKLSEKFEPLLAELGLI